MTKCQTCRYDTPEVHCLQGNERVRIPGKTILLLNPPLDPVRLTGYANTPTILCEKYSEDTKDG